MVEVITTNTPASAQAASSGSQAMESEGKKVVGSGATGVEGIQCAANFVMKSHAACVFVW